MRAGVHRHGERAGVENAAFSAGTIGRVDVRGDVAGSRIMAGVAGSGAALAGGVQPALAMGRIGLVTVGGDMRSTSIAAGVGPGQDGVFGTGDDVVVSSSLKGAISAIRVKGTLSGSHDRAESFGIIAGGQIGLLMAGGRVYGAPLQAGNLRIVDNMGVAGQ